jgi:holo-[acyl-carrier protein] synthase
MAQTIDALTLSSFTADYWSLNPADVTDDLTFSAVFIRKFSSLRFFRFLAALEDTFGVPVSDPGAVTTYAVLRSIIGAASQLGNGHTDPVEKTRELGAESHPPQSGIHAVGHDIEEITNLPEAADYRSHPFYRAHFSAGEIEYCIQSTNPRQHFAARFCAKEAVRKCGPIFAALDPRSIEVVNTESGQPCIRLSDGQDMSNFRLLVSLTHSDRLASAFVVVTAAD